MSTDLSTDLSAAHEKLQVITRQGQRLLDLAAAFIDTGNTKAGGDLSAIADALARSVEVLDQTLGGFVAEMAQQGFQNSENLLKASLAGVALAEAAHDKEGKGPREPSEKYKRTLKALWPKGITRRPKKGVTIQ